MNLFAKKIAELINVKTIITFAVIYIFVYLVVNGQVEAQATMQIVTMVIAFYFGTQYDKSGAKSGRQAGADDLQAQAALTHATKKQSRTDTKPEAEK